MIRRALCPLALTLALLAAAAPAAATDGNVWSAQRRPAPGPAEAIGSAAAGCLAGAAPLPAEGPGYQILRPARNRAWGHPATVAFIHDLATAAHRAGLPLLLIGDMAQPRGGPLPFGHASHQNGLDVDIWFRLTPRPLSREELAEPTPRTMVRGDAVDPDSWSPGQAKLIELAATRPEVDRMFVHPAIKRALCDALPPDRRGWLAKVRPWWGHTEHFHVRLACPADSPHCERQAPPPPGDGCGEELASWLARPVPEPKEHAHRQAKPLPAACGPVRKAK